MSTNRYGKSLQVVTNSIRPPLLCRSVTLAIVLVTAGGCAGITNGPVLLRVSQDDAAIMWETDTRQPGRLCYGKGLVPSKSVESTPEKVQYEVDKTGGQTIKRTTFIHKVWLKDLDPGQAYKYRIGKPAIPSKTYKFHTTPTDTDKVTFIVYGDSRSNPETHRKLVEIMKEKRVDFIVHTGDLVSRGDRYEQWGPQFFGPIKGLAETVPFYIAKGNHEGSGGNFERLLIPPGEKNSFSFDYGSVHYLCVDNVSRGTSTEKQLKRIAADASSSHARWRFVSYHVPSLNFGGHWSDWGYPDALPTLAKAGVDFVITGHSHQYERFRPVAPPDPMHESYVTYLTSGGGAAPLYDIQPALYHASAKQIHHFCLFHIDGDELTMDTIDVDGNIIDHLEISKSDGRLNKQYVWTAVPMEAVRFHQKLHSDLTATLPAKPEKDRPFTVTCKLSVPALTSPATMTFKLRTEEGAYQLPQPQTLQVLEGGTVEAKLTATALVDVAVPRDSRGRARPIVPALWLDCHYEIGRVQEMISKPVVAKPKRN